MPDRLVKLIKIACLILAVLLAVQIARMAPRLNPLARVVIPQLPTLPPPTNSAPSIATNPHEGTTNARGTNVTGTNLVTHSHPTHASTNEIVSTNSAAPLPTNAMATLVTNKIKNATAMGTNQETNLIKSGTNALVMGTNGISGGTNRPALRNGGMPGAMMMMAGMGGMGGMGGPPPAPLPPEIKARINRIYESEILGPVMHPMPEGLVGIAGDMAFLRSASGQTGMVKEGDSLGEMKLVRIGINRVLVEESGEQKELMIFEGYGGKSLLPDKGNKTNENAK